MRAKWLNALAKENALINGQLPGDASYICSLHFNVADYSHMNNGFGTRLRYGAVPSVFARYLSK